MTVSATAKAALFAQETGEAFLVLLTIDHPDLDMEDFTGPARFVDNGEDIVSRGETYLHFPFTVDLPPQEADRPSRMRLVIDNCNRSIVAALRQISTPPTISIEIVLASTPDVVEGGPFVATLANVDYDIQTIEGDLSGEDILNEPFPGDTFTPSNFPGDF